MRKERHSWYSPHLQRDMDILVYGHYGPPMVVFPTAGANCYEYEDRGMVEAIERWIEAGRVKIYCVDSVNHESWLNKAAPLPARALRQAQYDAYIAREIAPFIYHDCRTPGIPILTTGSSLGAYHAANSVFKHPDIFKCCIAMSGVYDLKRYIPDLTDYDANFYYNNPVDYLGNLDDDYFLPLLRATCDINIICGTGAWETPDFSRQISGVLQAKGIPHNLDLWGPDVAHDWPWWKIQISLYLDRKTGSS